MRTQFSRGLVELMHRGVLWLDVGMYTIFCIVLMGMRALGCAMGVDSVLMERDLAVLETVGYICIYLLMIQSCAAIFCAMGHFLQNPNMISNENLSDCLEGHHITTPTPTMRAPSIPHVCTRFRRPVPHTMHLGHTCLLPVFGSPVASHGHLLYDVNDRPS